jgi:hypothetical protein
MYRILFVFILFISCNNAKKNSQSTENLNVVKSKMMMYELQKYLTHADEVTNGDVKEFYIIFFKNGSECLFEINYKIDSYSLTDTTSNDGYLNINGKKIFFYGLNLPFTRNLIDPKFLKKEKVNVIKREEKYKYSDDLFQLYLITKGKIIRLAKA